MRETHEKSKTGHVERKRFPFNVAGFVILALHPSSGPGYARSTFPVGEGDLRRGNLKIQLCRQISVDVVADGLFLQDSGFSYLGSFRNPSP